MQWLIDHKDFFEVLSYISVIVAGPAAVFAAFQIYYAKKSVEATKRDSQIKSKHEAVILAAQICEKFAPFTQFKELAKRVAEDGLLKRWHLRSKDFTANSFQNDEIKKWTEDIRPPPPSF